jgi:hypothetical protein
MVPPPRLDRTSKLHQNMLDLFLFLEESVDPSRQVSGSGHKTRAGSSRSRRSLNREMGGRLSQVVHFVLDYTKCPHP